MRPDRHTQLADNRLCPTSFLFCLLLVFFGDVAFFSFSELFGIITLFSLYGEYVVRSFLPNGVFLPCDQGLDFDTSLCDYSINRSISQSTVPGTVLDYT